MAKKHCDKHYRYVASCENCIKANEDSTENGDEKLLYQDANLKDIEEDKNPVSRRKSNYRSPEIPNLEPDSTKMNSQNENNRFRYHREYTPNFKKKLIIIISILVFLILLSILYIYPAWYAKINLQKQLYQNKSNIDYWDVFTMGGWSTRFFFNKIGLMGALIGCLMMTLIPETRLFQMLSEKFGWKKPTTKKSLILWWTIGFAFFFLIGQAIEGGYFALTMQMISEGTIDSSFGSYFKALQGISNPQNISQLDLFLYSNVTLPILRYILAIIIIRLVINIVYYSAFIKNEHYVASNSAFIASIIFLYLLLARPLVAQDGISLILVWSLYFGFFIFLGLGIGLFSYGKKQEKRNISEFDLGIRKPAVISAVVIIILLLLPVLISVPTRIGLSDQNTWEEYKWDVKYSREIALTRTAAGITIGDTDYFQTFDIDDYPNNVIENDIAILDVIRQHDKVKSGKEISPTVTSGEATIADSDIIYVPDHGEYWVAPKTLRIETIEALDEKANTEFYDHAEGLIALDTSTGEIIDDSDYVDIFGVSSDYPIYFGEKEEDTDYLSNEPATEESFLSFSSKEAFDNSILLNTDWTSNSTYSYEGLPDGQLTGLQAVWYTMGLGLTSDAFNGEPKDYLINRNIMTRVEAVLLPGLEIDDDPYLIFDKNNSKMYYGLSIYTSINMKGYTNCPLYRFIGTVLIDVKTGVLSWYLNPGLPDIGADPLSPMWSYYKIYYPWNIAEDWLKSQLRYPESLWEKQLAVDYKYHVLDSAVWLQATDFYKRPGDSTFQGDVFYIETDLGEGLEFVGVDVVLFDTTESAKLAGLYIIRQGDHFGETYFYQTETAASNEDMIGPITARETFASDATTEIFKINNLRYGNILLYPLAGSLYYYIPVYSQDSARESLALTGLINAFNGNTYYGTTLEETYSKLKIDLGLNETISNNESEFLSLDISEIGEIEYDAENWALFDAYIKNYNTNDSLPQRNVTLNLTIRADVNMSVKVFGDLKPAFEYTFSPGISAYNYTLVTLNGTTGLYSGLKPGQGFSLIAKINPEIPFSASKLYVDFKFDLIDLDSGEIITSGWDDLVYNNPE